MIDLANTMFVEVCPGVIASCDSSPSKLLVKKDYKLAFCAKDIDADLYNLLSAAPAMYRALGIIHMQATNLNNMFDVAMREAPQLKNDPTFKHLLGQLEIMEGVCIEGRGFAESGLSNQLERIGKELQQKKK